MRFFVVFLSILGAIFLVSSLPLVGDVKSSRGYVDFFPNESGGATGRLDSQARLGLGTISPSANLHVSGNGIITEQLIIGGSTGSGNLYVHGSYGFSNQQSISSNITLSGNSRLLVSAASANIVLTLPDPSSVPGWIYSLKVIDDTFETDIQSSANIDGDATIRLNNGGVVKPSIELVNDGTAWYVLESTGFTPNRFWLLDHDAGQENGAFSGRTFERQVEVFAFKLYPTIEATTVDSLTFEVSGNKGISGADLSDFKLFIDSDASGNIEPSELTEVGGTPTVNFSTNTITFDGDFTVGGEVKYILKGDFVNLYWQDTLDLSMATGNVVATKLAMGGVESASHVTPYSLLIIEPTAGQEENIINNFPTSASSQEFFSFRIDPNGDGSDFTVSRLELTLTDVTGWTSSDLSNVRLYIDANANGRIDAGETDFVGGTPAINISGGTGNIVFTTSWTVTAAGNDIITVGDFANLDKLTPGDAITVTLSESNMTVSGNVFGGAADLQTATAVQSVGGDTQLYYATADPPNNALRQRFFNDTTGTWNDNLITTTGNTTVYWVVNQVSRTSPRQFIAAQSDDGGTARIDMMTYDGTSYSQAWNTSSLNLADENKRLFDMEIEALTGNAMIVFAEDSNGGHPVYRKYTGTGPDAGWTTAANVFSGTPPATGQVEWIELVRQSGSNEIALAYSDDGNRLICTIWNGTSWDNTRTQILETGSLKTDDTKCFDIEYEMLSGDLLAAWGISGTSGVNYATLKAGSSTWSDNAIQTLEVSPDTGDEPRLLDLGADPGTSRICLVSVNDNSRDFEAAIWTGSAWGDSKEVNVDVLPFATSGQFNISAGWAGPSGKALAIYDDNSSNIYWETWTETGGWEAESVHFMGGIGSISSMQSFTYFDESKLLLLLSDSTSLYALTTDGSSWTNTNGGAALETNLPISTGVPFYLDSYGQTALLLSDHRVGQRSEVFDAGASSGANLFNFLLKPREGLAKSVSSLTFRITNATGILDSDLSGLSIIVDDDGDGIADPTETTTIGGTPTISLGGGTGTITFSTGFEISEFTYLILAGNVLNLGDGDTMTLSLAIEDISLVGDTTIQGQVTSLPLIEGGSRLSNQGDARLVYGQLSSPTDQNRSRLIDGSDLSISSEGLTLAANTLVRWMEHAVHHSGQLELLIHQVTTGPTIEALRWDGQSWSNDWAVTGISATDVEKQGFDVAFESLSGNALVVYSDGTNSPKFRSFLSSANTWGPETPVYSSGVGFGTVKWVKLATQSGNNQISLAFSDSNNELHCIIWDGTGWRMSTNTTLDSMRAQDSPTFDNAFEDLTGDLLVVWGDGGDEISYAKMANDGSWSSKVTEPKSPLQDADIENMELEPLAGTDNIGISMYTDGRDWNGGIWTGTAFLGLEMHDNDMGAFTGDSRMMMEGAWLDPVGSYVTVARDSSTTVGGFFRIETWRSTGWSLTTHYETSMVVPRSFDVVTMEGENKVLISVLDEDGQLFQYHFDGTTVSDVGVNPQSTSVIENEGRAHQVGVFNPTRVMVADGSVGQVENGFTGAGSELNTELLSLRVIPHGGTFSVNKLVVDITGSIGISSSDLDGFRLMMDDDRDGVLDAGETSSLGGSGVLDFNAISGTGNIAFTTPFTLNEVKHLILTGNVSNLSAGDSITVVSNGSGLETTADREIGFTTERIHVEGGIGPKDLGDIRLLYYKDGQASLRTRLWDHSESTLSDEYDGPVPDYQTRWLTHTMDPNSAKEHVALQVGDGTTTQIEIHTYNGDSWSQQFMDTSISTTYDDYRGVDIATMSVSGCVMCVYTVNDGNPHYKVYDGSVWSGAADVLGSSSAGTVLWVQLAAQPGTDEIALAFQDLNNDLYAVTWNGTSWDTSGNVKLSEDIVENQSKGFDLGYESISGDLLVVWGESSLNGFFWTQKNRGSGSFSSTVREEFGMTGGVEPIQIIDITAHPSKDLMILSSSENPSSYDLNGAVWNGASWIEHRGLAGQHNPDDRRSSLGVEGAWLSQSDLGVVQSRLNNRTTIDYYTWDYNGWSGATTSDISDSDWLRRYSYHTLSHPTEDFIFMMWNDIDGKDRLYVAKMETESSRYDSLNDGEPLAVDVGALNSKPFSMSMRQPQMVILADHQGDQFLDTFQENGSESSANLFGFSIRPIHGKNLDISSITFRADDISGVTGPDLSSLFLYVDENGNKTVDPGETTTVGGVGLVSLGSQTGTITFSTNFLLDSELELILMGSAANLLSGDRIDLTLSTSDIVVANGSCIGGVLGVSHQEVGGSGPIVNGDGRFIYGSSFTTPSLVRSRVLTQSTLDMSDATPIGRGLNAPTHMRVRISPADPDTEIILGYSSTGNIGELRAFRRSGSNWIVDWSVETSLVGEVAPYRPFDLAFASQSGNALAVYSDGSENLKYREFNGATLSWESEASVFNGDVGGDINWVALTSNSGNNQIGLAVADDEKDLHLSVWNEGTWGANNMDVETGLSRLENQSFEVAYENVSGNLLAVWGRDSGNEIGYSTMAWSTNTWNTTSVDQSNDRVYTMVIASEPGSDNIMVAYQSDQSDLATGVWQDGWTWSERDSDMLRTNDAHFLDGMKPLGVGWLGDSGRAVVFYVDHGTATPIRSFEWTPSGGWSGQTSYYIDANEPRNFGLYTLKESDGVIIIMADNDAVLYALHYGVDDGGTKTFSYLNSENPIDQRSPTFQGVPFDFAERIGPQLLLANHPNGQVIDAFTGSGGETGARLFAYQLTPSAGSITVSDTTLTISSNTGLVNSDLSGNVWLFTDNDGDGQIEAGDTSVGGTMTVDLATGSLNFDGDYTVTGASSFIVSANIASLSEGDSLVLSLSSTNLLLTANYSVLGTTTAASHFEEAASNLSEENIRLVYATSGNTNLYSKVYFAANGLWGNEELLVSANTTEEMRTINVAVDPAGVRTSVQVFSADNPGDSDNDFSLFHNDGVTWTESVSQNDLNTYIRDAEYNKQPFALAYETLSGNAIAVSANTMNASPDSITWYSLSGNTWTKGGILSDTLNEPMFWAQMHSHPYRNEVTLLIAYTDDIYGYVWDGESWGTAQLLTTDYYSSTPKPVGGAYESMSGDFLAVWSGENFNGVNYATREDGSSSWSDNVQQTGSGVTRLMENILVPEPATDRIAFFFYDHGDGINGAIWTGNAMVFSPLDSTINRGDGFAPLGGAWLGDTGKFLAMYFDNNGGGNDIGYVTWDPDQGFDWPDPANLAFAISDIQNIEVISLDTIDSALILIQDSSAGLYGYGYDGTTFSKYDSETPIVTNLGDDVARTWDADIRRGPRLYVADPAGLQMTDVFDETGSVSDNALVAFRLKPTGTAEIDVSELVFRLENVSGVLTGDLSELTIRVDGDDDGVYEATDTATVGGPGVPNVSGADGTITFSDSFTVTGSNTYFLSANVASLVDKDQFDISLLADDVTSPRVVLGQTSVVPHREEITPPVTGGNLRVVYNTISSPSRLQTRIRNEVSGEWGDELLLPDSGHIPLYVTHKFGINGEEFIATQGVGASALEIGVVHRVNNDWSLAWSESGSVTSDEQKKTFDLAVESVSGNAMVVYSDGDDNPSWRYWNGSTWSSPASVFSGATPGSGDTVQWVRLEASPWDNRLGLVYSDDDTNAQLHAIIWDGEKWNQGTAINLETDLTQKTRLGFNVAFESLSGEMLVVWGKSGSNGYYVNQFSQSGNTWLGQEVHDDDRSRSNGILVLEQVHLQSHPSQDWVLMMSDTSDFGGSIYASMWNGTLVNEADRLRGAPGVSAAEYVPAGSWIGDSNKAYMTSAYSFATTFPRVIFDRGFSFSDDIISGISVIRSFVSLNMPFGNLGYFLLLDTNSKLLGFTHDGSTFAQDGASPIAESLVSEDTLPVSVSVKMPPMVRFSPHPVLDGKTDTFENASSVSQAKLFAFRITPILGEVNLTSLTFNITCQGISSSDINGTISLTVDDDGDGNLVGGESTVGGGGNVAIFAGSGTITFDGPFTLDRSKLLILRADVSGLSEDDFLTIELNGSNASVSQLGSVPAFHHRFGLDPINREGDGLLAYSVYLGENDPSRMRYRWFDTENNVFGPELSMPSSNTQPYFVDTSVSPSTNQALVVTQGVYRGQESPTGDYGTQIYRFDGANWNLDWQNWDLDVDGNSNGYPDRFSADGCYESISGNAIVVYSDDTNVPKYRTFVASTNTWSAEAPVTTSPLAASTTEVEWIMLKARPGSNDIMLAYADAAEKLFTIFYENGGWVESTNYEASSLLSSEGDDLQNMPMDMAWEPLSGNLLIVYGENATNELTTTTFDPYGKSYYTYRDHKHPSINSDVELPVVGVAVDRNRMLMTYQANNTRSYSWYWSGSSFNDGFNSRNTQAVNKGTVGYSIEGYGTDGKILMTSFHPQVTGLLAWTYSLDTGFVSNDSPDFSTLTDRSVMHTAEGMHHEDEVIVVFGDDQYQLHAYRFDGSWHEMNGGEPLTDLLATVFGQCVDLAVAQKPYILMADYPNGQPVSNLSNGSSSNVVIGRLQLEVNEGAPQTVTKMLFDLNLLGVQDSEIDNFFLVWDENENGVIDAGEDSTIGGEGVIGSVGGSSNLAFTESFLVQEERFYLLQADFSDIDTGDRLDLSLETSGITTNVDVKGSVTDMVGDAQSLSTRDIRIAYGSQEANKNIQFLVYDDSEGTWREEKGPNSTGLVYHVVHKISPIDPQEEIVVNYSVVGFTTTQFEAHRKTSSGWVTDWSVTGISYDSNSAYRRVHDVAYCQLSGDALVVYSDGDTNPGYQLYDASAGTWSSGNVLSSGNELGNTADWIKIVSKPRSNEIFVMISDQDEDLTVLFFDGSSFNHSTIEEVETALNNTSNQMRARPFDAAYESLSGDLMLVWGNGSNGINYRTMTDGTGVWSATTTDTQNNAIRTLSAVDLESDPKTDMILFGATFNSNSADTEVSVWTGYDWIDGKSLGNNASSAYTYGTVKSDTAWVESGREGLMFYNRNGTGQIVYHGEWDEYSTWSGELTVANLSSDSWVTRKGYSYRTQDKALFVAHDQDLEFHVFEADLDTWTEIYDGSGQENQVNEVDYFPWDFSVYEPHIFFQPHTLGSKPSQLEVDPIEYDVELMRFRANSERGGATVSVTQLVFDLTVIEGVKNVNLSNPRLYIDSDSDGNLSASEKSSILATGTAKFDVGTPTGNICFTSGFNLTNQEQDIILVVDLFNIVAEDAFSINLNVDATLTSTGFGGIGQATGSFHRTDKGALSGVGDVRVVWGQLGAGSEIPRSVVFDASSNTLLATQGLASGNSNIVNISSAVSPTTTHEVVVTGSGHEAGGNLSVMHSVDGVWSNVFWATGFDEAQAQYRGFDVAYSQTSGNALVVYGGGSNNFPRYRVHNSSNNTWGAESTIALGNDEVAWVELVAKPNSNEIALLWVDTNKELYGSIWNGETWGDTQSLDTSLHDLANKCFDAAYEYDTGDLLASWGTTSNGLFYATYSGGSWSGTSSYGTNQNQPESLDLAAAPSGNGIIIAYDANDSRLRGAFWSGTGFEDGILLENNSFQKAKTGQFIPAVAWWDGDNSAMIYDEINGFTNTPETLDWWSYSISGSNFVEEPSITFAGTSIWTSIKTMNMGDGRLFLVAQTRSQELLFFVFDGVAWIQHIPPDGTPKMVSGRSTPFHISVKGALE